MMEQETPVLAVIGVVTGILLAVFLNHASISINVSGEAAGLSSGQPDSQVPKITVTGDALGHGKLQRGQARLTPDGLRLAENGRSMEFYESPSYRLSAIEEVVAFVDIPAPNRSSVIMEVRASDNEDFAQEGNYWTTDQRRVSLVDGYNTFSITRPLTGAYVRVFFSMTRESTTTPSPTIQGYRIVGEVSQGSN